MKAFSLWIMLVIVKLILYLNVPKRTAKTVPGSTLSPSVQDMLAHATESKGVEGFEGVTQAAP